jgi:glycosyltransferase involved in cell wall biosynthesis
VSERWPTVDVVVPVLNEAAHLEAAIAAILSQEYEHPLQVHLAVGPSTDGTEQVAHRIAAADERVHVVANPSGRTPAALNVAIRNGDAEVVVRVDGHSELSAGYVRQAVTTLQRTNAVNVGGVQRAVGRTRFSAAVAAAMMSFAGTGGARFHVGGAAGPVDTVYLGVFRRQAIEAVGLFDERLRRNQDYELNIRLRAAGGTVWFDPALEVTYYPRSSWRALRRQYLEYGRYKRAVARLHPHSLKLRQVVPAAVTAAIGLSCVAAVFVPGALVVPLGYVLITAAAALRIDAGNSPRVALALYTMHLSWGVGFLTARPKRVLDTLGRP